MLERKIELWKLKFTGLIHFGTGDQSKKNIREWNKKATIQLYIQKASTPLIMQNHQLRRLHRDLMFPDIPPPTNKNYIRIIGQHHLPVASKFPWIVTQYAPVPASAPSPPLLQSGKYIHITCIDRPHMWCFGLLGPKYTIEQEFIVFQLKVDMISSSHHLKHTGYIAIPRCMVRLSPAWFFYYVTRRRTLPTDIVELWAETMRKPPRSSAVLRRSESYH